MSAKIKIQQPKRMLQSTIVNTMRQDPPQKEENAAKSGPPQAGMQVIHCRKVP